MTTLSDDSQYNYIMNLFDQAVTKHHMIFHWELNPADDPNRLKLEKYHSTLLVKERDETLQYAIQLLNAYNTKR